MTLPIRALPIVERWDCRSCGFCCRTTKLVLFDEDLRKLREQGWEKHPDFKGLPIATRHGLVWKHYRIGKRPDGACVFLTDDNLCRIHRDLGESAKPLTCRLFPFQLVPLSDAAFVTVRQYCPTAAAGIGRTLEEHLPYIAQLAEEGKIRPITLPAICPGCFRSWDELFAVAAGLERLTHDKRYPMARRLAHGLHFCDLIERRRMGGLSGGEFAAVLDTLEKKAAAEEKIGDLFDRPRRPEIMARLLFRQMLFEYLRLHPDYRARPTWGERRRVILGAAAFAIGKGRLNSIWDFFPAASFKDLEQPLGELEVELLNPLERFYEKTIAAKQYLLLGDASWTLVDGFRSLAVSRAAAAWILRLTCGNRKPFLEDVLKTVRTIDRGLGCDGLIGRRQKRRVNFLNRLGELTRLLAWYE